MNNMKLNSTNLEWSEIMRYCGRYWRMGGLLELLTVNLVQGGILLHWDVVLFSEADTEVTPKRRVLLAELSQRNVPKERKFNINTVEITHLPTHEAGFIQLWDSPFFSIFAEYIILYEK